MSDRPWTAAPKYDFLATCLRRWPDEWLKVPEEYGPRPSMTLALERRLEDGVVRVAQRRDGGPIFVRFVTKYEPTVQSPFAQRGQYAQRVLAL